MARILWFAGLILLQVLVLNYVHIHQFAKPLLYVYFILKLDSNTGRNQTMLWSFALGLCIDILSNTPGLNATASVLLAFFRQPLLQAQTTRDATGDFEPGIRTLSFLTLPACCRPFACHHTESDRLLFIPSYRHDPAEVHQ